MRSTVDDAQGTRSSVEINLMAWFDGSGIRGAAMSSTTDIFHNGPAARALEEASAPQPMDEDHVEEPAFCGELPSVIEGEGPSMSLLGSMTPRRPARSIEASPRFSISPSVDEWDCFKSASGDSRVDAIDQLEMRLEEAEAKGKQDAEVAQAAATQAEESAFRERVASAAKLCSTEEKLRRAEEANASHERRLRELLKQQEADNSALARQRDSDAAAAACLREKDIARVAKEIDALKAAIASVPAAVLAPVAAVVPTITLAPTATVTKTSARTQVQPSASSGDGNAPKRDDDEGDDEGPGKKPAGDRVPRKGRGGGGADGSGGSSSPPSSSSSEGEGQRRKRKKKRSASRTNKPFGVDLFKLPAMPANSGVFKPFRQVVRDTLSAAVKEKNDEAYQYATSVEAPGAVVADFDQPGRFARLDALLLLEIERIAKGARHRRCRHRHAGRTWTAGAKATAARPTGAVHPLQVVPDGR